MKSRRNGYVNHKMVVNVPADCDDVPDSDIKPLMQMTNGHAIDVPKENNLHLKISHSNSLDFLQTPSTRLGTWSDRYFC